MKREGGIEEGMKNKEKREKGKKKVLRKEERS